jgi:phosphoadenosine phosphosulfate reductase
VHKDCDFEMDLPPSFPSTSASAFPAFDLEERETLEQLRQMEQDGADGRAILAHAITGPLRGRSAAVSSFGAESAVLLSIIAEIDPSVPVVFLETGKHFPETLAYREELAAHLGLTDVRDVVPREQALRDQDPTGELWYYDPDACCRLRKVGPLERALAPFGAWISGRKRFQAQTRAALPFVEQDGARLKLNPLADWDAGRIEQELTRRALPRHPLVARGYPSIGCSVCTRSVAPGEDSRAGRWSGSMKVECGIHSARVPA